MAAVFKSRGSWFGKLLILLVAVLCFPLDTGSISAPFSVSAQEQKSFTDRGTLNLGGSASAQDRKRSAAESIIIEAEELRRQSSIEANRLSEKKYQEGLALWRSVGADSKTAATLRSMGELVLERGDRQLALHYLNESLRVSRRAKDVDEETGALNALGYVQTLLGKYNEAVAILSRALELSRRFKSRQNEAQALTNLGETHHDLGQLPRALECEQESLRLWSDLNDGRGQAQALLRIGYIKMSMGEVQEALSAYQESLRLFRSVNHYRDQAFVLAALGHLYSQTGNKQQAITYYDQAKTLCQNIDDPFIRAELSAGMGYVYYELGDNEQALEYKKQALAFYRQLSDRWGEAALHLSIGKIYLAMGKELDALNEYQSGSPMIRALSNTRLETSLLSQTGEVYERLGNKTEALANYLAALSLTRSGKNPRAEAVALNNIGRLRAAMGQKEQAARDFKRALSISETISDRFTESVTLANIARLDRDRGDLSAATRNIESAVQVMESLRSNVQSRDLRTSYFATVRQNYELYVDILMQFDKQQPAHGYLQKAFEISERARARALVETLGEAREGTGVDQGFLQLPEPLRLSELQTTLLDENTLILEYMLGDDRSYGWLVTRTNISGFELPPRVEIEQEVHRYYELLTAKQPRPGDTIEQIRARAKVAEEQLASETATLSKLLLSPVAASLNRKRLLLVLDGGLQYIPFQALTVPTPDTNISSSDGQRPLLMDHEIVNEPSASTLALVLQTNEKRKTARGSVAVFADPVFDADDSRLRSRPAESIQPPRDESGAEITRALRDVGFGQEGIPRLLWSRQEADFIMAEVPWGTGFKAVDFAASRETVAQKDLAQYRIVHLATHALLNNDHPELSGILLSLIDSSGTRKDGFLRLQDIYQLKLPVDLVVLSACQTGLGKDVKGEGLISLTRGFLYAGASGVVASLWKVDDDATAELMKHFYREMFENARPPAAALREAQLKMRQTKRWQNPYYWAGFVIQGQYSMKDSFKRDQRYQYVVVLGASLSLIVIFMFWRRHRRNI